MTGCRVNNAEIMSSSDERIMVCWLLPTRLHDIILSMQSQILIERATVTVLSDAAREHFFT